MIIPTTEASDRVLGFKIGRKLTAEDYEDVLMPAIDARVKRDGVVRMVMEWADDFAGWELKAMFDDAKLGFSHWNHFSKLALVGAPHGVEWVSALFDRVSKGKIRVFAADEMDQALAWASQD